MAEQTKIRVVYYGTSEPPWLSSIEKSIMTDSALTFERRSEITQLEPGIAVIRFDPKDSTAAQVLVKMTEATKLLKQGLLKIYISCKAEHPKLIELLMKKGASDLIADQTAPRTALHKIKKSATFLLSEMGKSATASQKKEVDFSKTLEQKEAEKISVDWIAPKACDSDFWLIEHPKHVRYMMGKWTFEVLGPAPSCGSWEKGGSKESPEWKWVPRPKAPAEFQGIPHETWCFKGKEPIFAWDKNRWIFSGEKPELSLTRMGSENLFRIQLATDKQVRVWKSSEVALTLKPQIEATFNTEIHIHEQRKKVKKHEVELGADEKSKELFYKDEDDEAKKAWNDNRTEDEAAEDWNKDELGNREEIEGGGGIGMGQANSANQGYAYDVTVGPGKTLSIPVGDDAFVSLKLVCFVSNKDNGENIPCEILDITPNGLFISYQKQLVLNEKVFIQAHLRKSNGEKVSKLFFWGGVLSKEFEVDTHIVQVGLDSSTRNKLENMMNDLSMRQTQADGFLKLATGR